jgi:hypothetical protein
VPYVCASLLASCPDTEKVLSLMRAGLAAKSAGGQEPWASIQPDFTAWLDHCAPVEAAVNALRVPRPAALQDACSEQPE